MNKLVTSAIGTTLNTMSFVAPEKAGRLGFRLFCHPMRGKITSKHLEFFHTATQSVIEHEGEEIKVYQWGNGNRKILFLHGWQSHSYRWKAYVRAMDQDKYTLYAFDAPGHGQSTGSFLSVPLYSSVIKHIVRDRGPLYAMIGHSLGGFTALYTLYQYPELMPDKLILLAPPGEATEFFAFYQNTLHLTKRALRLTIHHFEKVFDRSPSYFSATTFADGLTLPGLIIHDKNDMETSVENSKAIHAIWPNSKLHITEGAGHNLKSKKVIQEILDFVDSYPTEKQQLS